MARNGEIAADLPEKLGKYHVLGLAGQGNMGVVYVGYDPFTDRDVAIKVPTLPPGGEPGAARLSRKMFYNEAHMAGLLDHPNILRILDAGEEGGVPYIVMEYVEGGETLRPCCAPSRLLPVERVGALVARCARALDYAHRRGVVHRDIKPTNIMLSPDGDVKMGDFGIAQRQLEDTTQVLGLIGSPRYMSPEQMREEVVTGQSDLYSLGVVMFELLTGRLPFTATALQRLIHQVISAPAPRLRDLRPDIPEGLDTIVHIALAKDPARRYATGSALAADIALLFGERVREPAPGTDDERRFQAVRALGFFNGFSDSEIWETLHAAHWARHGAGEILVAEGSVDYSLYVLISGEARVSRHGGARTTLERGDCFGELGYLPKGGRNAAIEALTDVTLLRISERNLEFASDACQLRLHKAFVRSLIGRLAGTGERLPVRADRRPPAADAGAGSAARG